MCTIQIILLKFLLSRTFLGFIKHLFHILSFYYQQISICVSFKMESTESITRITSSLSLNEIPNTYAEKDGFLRIPVHAVNPHLICGLCQGYLYEACTITECMHSCEKYFLIYSPFFPFIYHNLQIMKRIFAPQLILHSGAI